MSMIVDDRRPIASERTRVFASDLVAMAKVQHLIGAATEQMHLEPRRMARLAALALDAGDLTSEGIPAELVLAVAAVGLKPPHDLAAFGLTGLIDLCANGRAFADARDVWLEHMERGPERRTAFVLREHMEEEALSALLARKSGEAGAALAFRGQDDLPDAC